MAEAGIFGEDDRVELLHGEIIKMSPIGSPHIACVNRLTRLFNKLDECILSIQNPVSVDDFSEPEPDVALLRYQKDFYQKRKPRPEDVLLLIEVADSTIENDKKIKVPLYAFAGIEEVWLIDLLENEIIVFTEPVGGAYRQSRQYFPGETILCGTIENLTVAVSDVIWTG